MRPESGFQVAPNQSSIEKTTMISWFADKTSSSIFFDVVMFFLSGLSGYWSKFHTNTITGCGDMTIFVYSWFDQKLRNWKYPVWVLSNIWRLVQVRDTKFGMNAPNEKLLNVAKCKVYSFYLFWVIKGKPTGGNTPSHPD